MISLQKSIPKIKQSAEPFHNSRIIKDEKEIMILKSASRCIDMMFERCPEVMKIGQQETELQNILMSYAMEFNLSDTGYRSTLNPLIIAGGPNGAFPHAQPTQRRFERGDLVVVDITLRYMGYVSDATRTFALGSVTEQQAEAYDMVRESQRRGVRSVRKRDGLQGRG